MQSRVSLIPISGIVRDAPQTSPTCTLEAATASDTGSAGPVGAPAIAGPIPPRQGRLRRLTEAIIQLTPITLLTRILNDLTQ
jgi:hypothetical protein